MRSRLPRLRVLAAGVLAMMLSPAAPAQPADAPPSSRVQAVLPPSIGEAFQPDFLRRDIPVFVADLQLDATQQTILESLFIDYEQAFRDGAAAARGDLTQLRPSPLELDEMHEQIRQSMRDEVGNMMKALEEAQKEGASAQRLHDLQQPYRNRIEALRNRRTEIWKQMAGSAEEAPALRLDILERLDAWDAERVTLRDSFVDGVTALLNEEQQTWWPPLERKLRRTRLLPRGRLSGESVDLHAILAEFALDDPPASLAPTMLDYEVALDEALRSRQRMMDATQRDLYLASSAGDVAVARPLLRQQTDERIAVRMVNDRYVDLVAVVLGDVRGERIRRRAWEEGYPRVFRPTAAGRTLDAALALPDLADETRATVEALRDEYALQLLNFNRSLVKAIRAQEPRLEVEQLERRLAQRNGETIPPRLDDAVRVLFQDRTAAGRVKLDALRELLTPEQIAQLPVLTAPVRTVSPGEQDDLRARFDTNGDGHLSATEREAVARYLHERQRQGTSGGE